MTLLLILLLALLILAIALFSAAETAFFSLSSMKVKALREDASPRKRLVAELVLRPKDLLITLIICIVITSILVQNVVATLFEGAAHNWAYSVGVPLALNLVLGEVIPKALAMSNNERISCWTAPIVYRIQKLLVPVRWVLGSLTNHVVRICFFFLRTEREISLEELGLALRTSQERGVVQPDEARLINGYLHLQEASVKELMRPREEVLFYDMQEPLSRLTHLLVDQELSRVPVCQRSLDEVLGIMTAQTFFLHREEIRDQGGLTTHLEKPFFVPESTPADTLLKQMYAHRTPFAMVVDEYGSISGLIAMEDLIEVVVGQIADRRDEKSRYTQASDDVIIASGKLEITEFAQIFQCSLESRSNVVTLGGWLIEQLGDIPKSGTKYVTKDFLFQVLSADSRRIRRIYVRRLRPAKGKMRT